MPRSNTRPTAEIVADLRATDQYLHWSWTATVLEAAERLVELEAMLVAAESRASRRLRTIKRYEAEAAS